MTTRMRINPANFYNRELGFLPPHFKNIAVKAHEYDVDQMRKWIYEHCAGRYSITRDVLLKDCLLYTSPSPRDLSTSRMPSSA